LTLELQGAQSINYTCNEACNNRVDKQFCGTGSKQEVRWHLHTHKDKRHFFSTMQKDTN